MMPETGSESELEPRTHPEPSVGMAAASEAGSTAGSASKGDLRVRRRRGRRRGRRSALQRFGRPAIVPSVAFLVWLGIAQAELIDPVFLPGPGEVLDSAIAMQDELLSGLLVSLQMIAIGFVIGGAAGIGAGLLFGYSRMARDLFELTVDLIRPIPLFALIPLFILWFGIGMRPQITLVAFGVFLILSLSTIEAIRNVPQIYVRAALTSGATPFQVYRTVVIPAITPHMLSGLRFAVAAAWGLDVAAEFTGSQEGLGYLMIVREQVLDTSGILAIVLIFCLLAIVADRLIRAGITYLTRWSERSTASGMVGEMLGGR